jgi:tetratricopeptide (TPR) repeat protein
MRQEGPGKALAWMATGAAVLLAGAFVGAAAGRREGRRPAGPAPEPRVPEDLEDRPLAREAWADTLAAARQVDQLVDTVAGLEARVRTVEANTRRADEVWQRVLRLEQAIEELRGQPAAEEVERRVMTRVSNLEARVDQQDTAIQQLQAHAAQTDANLQRMIQAVEKLTEQISRALPAAPQRIEPRREETEARPAGWRSVALIGAIALGLVGSYGALRQMQGPAPVAAAAVTPAPITPDQLLDTAITSLAAVAETDPENLQWRLELGRLNALKGNRAAAERWYRSILEVDPHDRQAVNALADLTNGSR